MPRRITATEARTMAHHTSLSRVGARASRPQVSQGNGGVLIGEKRRACEVPDLPKNVIGNSKLNHPANAQTSRYQEGQKNMARKPALPLGHIPMESASRKRPTRPFEPPMRSKICRNCTCARRAMVPPPPPHPCPDPPGRVSPCTADEADVLPLAYKADAVKSPDPAQANQVDNVKLSRKATGAVSGDM